MVEKNLYSVLADNEWHPVVSNVDSLFFPMHFLVSELPTSAKDHSNARSLPVLFNPNRHTRADEGFNLSVIGSTALIHVPHHLELIIEKESGEAVVRLEQTLPSAANRAYTRLLPQALPLRQYPDTYVALADETEGYSGSVRAVLGNGRYITIAALPEDSDKGPYDVFYQRPSPSTLATRQAIMLSQISNIPRLSVYNIREDGSALDNSGRVNADEGNYVTDTVAALYEAAFNVRQRQNNFLDTPHPGLDIWEEFEAT